VNWAVWGPVFGTVGVAFLGLIGVIFQTRKTHRATLAQVEVTKTQSEAAVRQADAALEAARASSKTAEVTAAAAIQDAITRATEANDKHWAIYLDAGQRRVEDLEKLVSKNAERIEQAELRSEAAEVRANKAEHLYAIATVYLRRVIRWINDNLPGEDYPPPPPELDLSA
jgi:hypothetical protein